VAFLSAKLCDVFPDGTSTLVARGFLNLTRRRSLTRPEPLRPGLVEPVELELDATSWVFPAGHRLRLSLAGTDWPNTVPPPGPVTLTVQRAGSVLTLPVLDGPSPCPPPTLPAPRPPDPAKAPTAGTGTERIGEIGEAAGTGATEATGGTGGTVGTGGTGETRGVEGTGGTGVDPPVVWRVVRDVLGRTTRAEIGHGGRTVLDGGPC
jgi:uncharacterized protein